jgi:cytidylate kinase
MESTEVLIERQIKRWEVEQKARREQIENGVTPDMKPIVTVSRQKGSQGTYLAEKMAERLGYQLLHKEIIDMISTSSGYRRKIIESLDDKIRSRMDLWVEGMFKGMYIDASDYFRYLYRVIMSISELGGVLVVGRGANFMLKRDQGYNIRVIASRPKRIANLMEFRGMDHDEAEKETRKFDRERSGFVRNNFNRDINDPKAYDVIINTTYLDIERAIEMVEMGMESKFKMIRAAR